MAVTSATPERRLIAGSTSFWGPEITKTIEDGYRYEVKISGPQKDVLPAIKRLSGVAEVTATGARDADAYVYAVDTVTGADVRKPLFNLCAENGWPMIGLTPIGTDLETVFIRLVDNSEGAIGRDPRAKRARS